MDKIRRSCDGEDSCTKVWKGFDLQSNVDTLVSETGL